MATVTNILIVVLSICCATVTCDDDDPVMQSLNRLEQQITRLDQQNTNINDQLVQLSSKVDDLQTALTNRLGQFNGIPVLLKACPHCRRKVRQSPNFAIIVSPFSATVALFCDSVDRALLHALEVCNLSKRQLILYQNVQYCVGKQ